jgi:hypothetical protein
VAKIVACMMLSITRLSSKILGKISHLSYHTLFHALWITEVIYRWHFVIRPSSPDDFGDLEPEVVDCDTGGSVQESERGSDFAHEMLDEATSSHQASYSPRTSFPATKASWSGDTEEARVVRSTCE